MDCDIKNYLIILILILLIDLPMSLVIYSDMYTEQFKRINNGPMNISEMTIVSMLISYILLATGLYVFVLKPSYETKPSQAKPSYDTKPSQAMLCPINTTLKGALFGFIVYGMYNYVNLATINEYGNLDALYDTIWGTVLCGFTTYMFTLIKQYY
jgi:uncharacterized membrane protein